MKKLSTLLSAVVILGFSVGCGNQSEKESKRSSVEGQPGSLESFDLASGTVYRPVKVKKTGLVQRKSNYKGSYIAFPKGYDYSLSPRMKDYMTYTFTLEKGTYVFHAEAQGFSGKADSFKVVYRSPAMPGKDLVKIWDVRQTQTKDLKRTNVTVRKDPSDWTKHNALTIQTDKKMNFELKVGLRESTTRLYKIEAVKIK